MKMMAASPSRPRATAKPSTIRTTKDRAIPLEPSVRDAMLAAVPRLRAFAISLSGKVDRADDLVQETLSLAMANIHSFQPGTNMPGWLLTILRNRDRANNPHHWSPPVMSMRRSSFSISVSDIKAAPRERDAFRTLLGTHHATGDLATSASTAPACDQLVGYVGECGSRSSSQSP